MSKKKNFEPHYSMFTNNKNLVKIGCSHAGKVYYGIAKCAPEDEFNLEYGIKLAKARCDYQIMTVKLLHSQELISMWRKVVKEASKALEEEYAFEQDVHNKWLEASKVLEELEC